ncbi:MAG: EAL domain-containing protein [Campylobacterales bacterium]|nr:EAL domain-containing protein [Campylobacterales bacterium]
MQQCGSYSLDRLQQVIFGVALLFLMIIVGKTVINYHMQRKMHIAFIEAQAQTLATLAKAHRDYYQKLYIENTIPLNAQTLEGLPAFAAGAISERFSKENLLRIVFAAVSDRPRNPKHTPDATQRTAMEYFRTHPQATEHFTSNDALYQFSTPLYIEPKCLICHGTRDAAPDFIRERYDEAYDYALGDLRGIISIQIPKSAVDGLFWSQFTRVLIYDGALLLTLFGLLLFLAHYFRQMGRTMDATIIERTRELSHSNAILESYKEALDRSSIVSKSDLDGRITYVNAQFEAISGYNKEELLGQSHALARHLDTPKETIRMLWQTIRAKKLWHGILKNRKKDGGSYRIDALIMPILDEHGEISEFIAVRHEITALIEQQQRLHTAAYSHTLTGLPNRLALIEQLPGVSALALIDIEAFSQINDVYGHEIGDALLHRLSELFGRHVDEDAALYHLHADEFAFTCKHVEGFDQKIIKVIEQVNAQPFVIGEFTVVCRASAGISFERTQLLSSADAALKQARALRQDSCLFEGSMQLLQTQRDQLHWITQISSALRDDRIVLYYQAIIDVQTQHVCKYEALIRMIDSDGNVIAPFYFLEPAKRSRQYGALSLCVVTQALSFIERTQTMLSINLSAEDLSNTPLCAYLLEGIAHADLGSLLCIELVESEAISQTPQMLETIMRLKELGCSIAIDDFGSGYSNFTYLMQLKADIIKIDGSIIKALTHDKGAQSIVKAIVTFAQEMQMRTIAEYVEDKALFETVKAYGIDAAQGYYFAKPQAEHSLFLI